MAITTPAIELRGQPNSQTPADWTAGSTIEESGDHASTDARGNRDKLKVRRAWRAERIRLKLRLSPQPHTPRV
jgi:hypothetical protein